MAENPYNLKWVFFFPPHRDIPLEIPAETSGEGRDAGTAARRPDFYTINYVLCREVKISEPRLRAYVILSGKGHSASFLTPPPKKTLEDMKTAAILMDRI